MKLILTICKQTDYRKYSDFLSRDNSPFSGRVIYQEINSRSLDRLIWELLEIDSLRLPWIWGVLRSMQKIIASPS